MTQKEQQQQAWGELLDARREVREQAFEIYVGSLEDTLGVSGQAVVLVKAVASMMQADAKYRSLIGG